MQQNSQNQEYQQLLTEEQQIKQKIKTIPYSLLLKQQQQQQIIHENKSSKNLKSKNINLKNKFKTINTSNNQQQNQYAPKQVNIHRKHTKQIKQIFKVNSKEAIDPRFQSYAGNLNADLASKSYSFIGEMQKRQIKQLKNSLQSKSKKIGQNEREILQKRYGELKDETRRQQLKEIQKKVRNRLGKHGQYYPKKKNIKSQIQHQKLKQMNQSQALSRINKKHKKIEHHKNISKHLISKNIIRKLK